MNRQLLETMYAARRHAEGVGPTLVRRPIEAKGILRNPRILPVEATDFAGNGRRAAPTPGVEKTFAERCVAGYWITAENMLPGES